MTHPPNPTQQPPLDETIYDQPGYEDDEWLTGEDEPDDVGVDNWYDYDGPERI